MILPVVLIFLSTAFGQNLYAGDVCNLSNGTPGVCVRLSNCSVVYQQLMAGHAPDKVCGFEGFESIVCCPQNLPTTVTKTPEVTVDPVGDGRGAIARQTTTTAVPEFRVNPVGNGRGAIARQKCAEYAQFVWTLERSPILLPGVQLVNVSNCAITSQKLVVGGTKADRMEFPHMAAIGYYLETGGIGWHCGGTLISERFVLTAAHCTFSRTWGNAEWVRLGDLNLIGTDDGATPIDVQVAERIWHPQYKQSSRYHDIALLRLESSVRFNGWIRPACLHTAPSTGTNEVIATGWGHVAWGEDVGSGDLLKVTLPLVDQETCNRTYTSHTVNLELRNGIFGDRMLCAGESGRDTCQGDSGGPIVIYSKPEYYCMYDVVGVTSFGRFCGSVIPGVYTRVYYYIPWIESIVWGRE